jgi:hypothetical protein
MDDKSRELLEKMAAVLSLLERGQTWAAIDMLRAELDRRGVARTEQRRYEVD